MAHGVDRHVGHESQRAISDGWKFSSPIRIQRELPLTAWPMPGISTSDEQREARDQQPGRDPLPQRYRHDEHRSAERAAEQDGEELPLEMEERVARQPLRDVEGSRGDHHEADEQQAEDRGDDHRVDGEPLLAACRARVLQ